MARKINMAPKSTNQLQSELASNNDPQAPSAPQVQATWQGHDALQVHDGSNGSDEHKGQDANKGSDASKQASSHHSATEHSDHCDHGANVGSNAYQDDEDDYGLPPKKISYEQALELSKQQQGLVSVISMLQVIVVCMFMAGFIGYVKGHGIIKELSLNNDQVEQLQARLLELSGPLVEQGAIGSALWFMASSLVGGLSLLIPIAIYNVIARSADRSYGKSAGVTLYDVIRAEILKYALMIIILALAFKFTSLNALVMMATFVIVMFAQIIKSALSLGRRS